VTAAAAAAAAAAALLWSVTLLVCYTSSTCRHAPRAAAPRA